jgi:ADP-heptose:LPS heptosyltransferase
LLIWGEQGLGDQIIYASMISDAQKRADKIVLEVEPRLISLFKRSFPKAEVRPLLPELNEDGISAHTPIGSLGGLFRLHWSDFLQRAYLIADQARAKELHSLLQPNKKCVIGISWRSMNKKAGEHKTALLRDFASMLLSPEIGFVDLQYGETADELDAIQKEFGVAIRHVDEIDNKNDIDGLAALIEACDAVVTVSNTTAHIAGALGKPVWILIPHGQGRIWYWFKDRKDSPWYPGARIVRQQPGQSWADLVASIAPEISEFARDLKPKA